MSKFFTKIRNVAKKNGGDILLGTGIAGMWAAVCFCGKASEKARDILDDYRVGTSYYDEEGNFHYSNPCLKDRIKLTWKCYIPTAVSGAVGTACLIGSNKFDKASLASATAATEFISNKLEEYKKSVEETTDEETQKKIDKKSGEKANETFVRNNGAAIHAVKPGEDLILCKDHWSGREFYSNEKELDMLAMKGARIIEHDDILTYNELWSMLGDSTNVQDVPFGDEFGWWSGQIYVGDDSIIDRFHFIYSAEKTIDGRLYLDVDYSYYPVSTRDIR